MKNTLSYIPNYEESKMSITFEIIPKGSSKKNAGYTIAYLEDDSWNDYSFQTSFTLIVFDDKGEKYNIGYVKIGFFTQTDSISTQTHLPDSFKQFDDIFSLGQDVEYYKNIYKLPIDLRKQILKGLKDVASDEKLLGKVKNEDVFKVSLTRTITIPTIRQQFSRVLEGGVALTPYNFSYKTNESEIPLEFNVRPDSVPPTNIHVLIGKNGTGKTTLLNGMIDSLLCKVEGRHQYGHFFNTDSYEHEEIEEEYFSSIVFVSFSAFDSFEKPAIGKEQEQLKFSYIGLKNHNAEEAVGELKNSSILCADFIEHFGTCLDASTTKERWLLSISLLQSDENFDMELIKIVESNADRKSKLDQAKEIFEKMSSGHAVVLLTITQLVTSVAEKTLVLIDEPEGHLHPPLLSAFIHVLSKLLINRNGVAIIATHSPVVLQEVPRSNVWNIVRSGSLIMPQRLEIETYGENVGTLTREVFGLEVRESGFHKVLKEQVETGKGYNEIIMEYNEQLGFEARSILRALVFNRDKKK